MKNILFVVLLIIVNVTIVFSQAVYSCEYKSDAGWQNKSKMHWMY